MKPFLPALNLFILAQVATAAPPQFQLSPYNEYDSYYVTQVRTTVGSFHPNLSKGNYKNNGPLVSTDLEWNNVGDFLQGRESFVNELGSFGLFFNHFDAPDQYQIVDGHLGAILFYNSGQQKADFAGVKNEGRSFNVFAAELMSFNTSSKLEYLITVQEQGLLLEQLSGKSKPEDTGNITLKTNPQTPPEYRQNLKDSIITLHQNLNAGQNARNAELVSADVDINADSVLSKGKQAFVDLLAADQKSFPDLLVHDDYILADGNLGAIEYVWQGTQTGVYTAPNGTVFPPKSTPVRVREFLFFEFDGQGLATKVVRVRDEGAIARQLESSYVYP